MSPLERERDRNRRRRQKIVAGDLAKIAEQIGEATETYRSESDHRRAVRHEMFNRKPTYADYLRLARVLYYLAAQAGLTEGGQ